MFNIWPYFLRFAIAIYFIYPHVQNFLTGSKKLNTAMFGCLNEYIPTSIAFTLWNALFIILGVLILILPRPIFPLIISLFVLSSDLYIHFSTNNYTATNMLLFVLVLVNLALIIYHSRPQFR